ncbi:MAG: AmmeMemoRadiSam system radical SAM enzyme [Desulfovibrio sp.]|nr:AmmeMemoRadiSam system radical SAM enzyme [Desulfovibrio sp.]
MQAMLWTSQDDGSVRCGLCAHGCQIRKNKKGRCGVRVNLRGELVSLVNEVMTSVAMDPVEKKPLYHFLPGTRIFSVGSAGCNFTCRFCQNSNISQVPESGVISGRRINPEELISLAADNKARSLAFTYNEPTVFLELVYETAMLAKGDGMRVALVTNGFMSQDCLQVLSTYISAANVDLKGFSDAFYRSFCGGRLQPVLDNLKTMHKLGWWLEVTTLIIPGVNNNADELKALAAFIHDELGPDTPWHVTAFHGAYRMAEYPATPLPLLEQARDIGLEAGLHFVYIGNVTSPEGSTTFCPQCGKAAIKRTGLRVTGGQGQCPSCGAKLPGIWN